LKKGWKGQLSEPLENRADQSSRIFEIILHNLILTKMLILVVNDLDESSFGFLGKSSLFSTDENINHANLPLLNKNKYTL